MTYEVNTVITSVSVHTSTGTWAMSNKVTERYTSALQHIRALAQSAGAQVIWSDFYDRNDYLVEKAAIQWTNAAGVRCSDVVWVRRGWTRRR